MNVNVEPHRPLETAAWFADGRDVGNFEHHHGTFNYMDDPDLFLDARIGPS